jgi:hypothetical protein
MLIITFVGLQMIMLLLGWGKTKGIEEINISKAILIYTIAFCIL